MGLAVLGAGGVEDDALGSLQAGLVGLTGLGGVAGQPLDEPGCQHVPLLADEDVDHHHPLGAGAEEAGGLEPRGDPVQVDGPGGRQILAQDHQVPLDGHGAGLALQGLVLGLDAGHLGLGRLGGLSGCLEVLDDGIAALLVLPLGGPQLVGLLARRLSLGLGQVPGLPRGHELLLEILGGREALLQAVSLLGELIHLRLQLGDRRFLGGSEGQGEQQQGDGEAHGTSWGGRFSVRLPADRLPGRIS